MIEPDFNGFPTDQAVGGFVSARLFIRFVVNHAHGLKAKFPIAQRNDEAMAGRRNHHGQSPFLDQEIKRRLGNGAFHGNFNPGRWRMVFMVSTLTCTT